MSPWSADRQWSRPSWRSATTDRADGENPGHLVHLILSKTRAPMYAAAVVALLTQPGGQGDGESSAVGGLVVGLVAVAMVHLVWRRHRVRPAPTSRRRHCAAATPAVAAAFMARERRAEVRWIVRPDLRGQRSLRHRFGVSSTWPLDRAVTSSQCGAGCIPYPGGRLASDRRGQTRLHGSRHRSRRRTTRPVPARVENSIRARHSGCWQPMCRSTASGVPNDIRRRCCCADDSPHPIQHRRS